MAETHQRAADRLLHVCLLHGGLYVKLGQFIASMNYVLPQQFPTVMAACQDRASVVGFDAVRTALERELGMRVEDAFARFDEEPVASASLAQVHRAVTHDGRSVACKVQYPQLPRQIEADMRTLRLLASVVGYAFPQHEYQWLVPEFETSTRQELDFTREAANSQRTRELVRPIARH